MHQNSNKTQQESFDIQNYAYFGTQVHIATEALHTSILGDRSGLCYIMKVCFQAVPEYFHHFFIRSAVGG